MTGKETHMLPGLPHPFEMSEMKTFPGSFGGMSWPDFTRDLDKPNQAGGDRTHLDKSFKNSR